MKQAYTNWNYDQLDIIYTSRCRLRPIHPSDASSLLRMYSNPAVIRFTEHHMPMQSLEEADYSIQFYRKGYAEGWMYRWGVTLIADNRDRIIGTVGLHRINYEHTHSSIGYELDEPYWGKGLSTEIVGALTDYGFKTMELHRLEAELIPQNIASARVLIKNGYRYEATRRQSLKKRLTYYDIDVYGILRSEWQFRQQA